MILRWIRALCFPPLRGRGNGRVSWLLLPRRLTRCSHHSSSSPQTLSRLWGIPVVHIPPKEKPGKSAGEGVRGGQASIAGLARPSQTVTACDLGGGSRERSLSCDIWLYVSAHFFSPPQIVPWAVFVFPFPTVRTLGWCLGGLFFCFFGWKEPSEIILCNPHVGRDIVH